MATPNIVPRAEGEGGLGTAAKGWGGLFVTNTTADSSTQGGKLVLAGNDGAAMQSGSRLGVIEFKGAESASTLTIGARIEAITDAGWSASENGASLKFYTTDGNASESVALTLDSDNLATFTGDVKVSNTAESTSTSGGVLSLICDDSAAMGDDHRLGAVIFRGAEDSGNTLRTGAKIQAMADAAWSASENGTRLEFYTMDGNASSELSLTLDSDLLATFAGSTVTAGTYAGKNYRTIWIDAGAMVPAVTNGAAAGTEEAATNDVMSDYFAFDTSTTEYVQFKTVIPEQWDAGTIKAKFYWKPASSTTTSHTVTWAIQATAHGDGGTIDSSWGTVQEVNDDVLGTAAGRIHVTAATGAMTVAGSPASGADNLVYFRVSRASGSAAADDLTEDAHLLGVLIQYRESNVVDDSW